MSESNIFDAARRIADPAEQQAYLEQACAGDVELLARIRMYLEINCQPDGFLDLPSAADPAEPPQPPADPQTQFGVFETARRLTDPAERRAYLSQACAGNPEMKAAVERLLQSADAQSSFLNVPATDHFADPPPFDHNEPDSRAANDAPRSAQDHIPSLKFLSPSARPGSLGSLDHYNIIGLLGWGAYGTVLKAFDETLHRTVAIKVLSPEIAATSPARKRYLREARAAASIRHENIAHIYSVGETPLPYLVMEYVPGGTLQDRLDETGPLDVIDVLRIATQTAEGLAAAHAQSLVHRDIKPANILLDRGIEERVKITDFGLARAADDASRTQSGVIAGTPLYMAPEQATAGHINQRSDLFSLGSVLYAMVTGRAPFRAPTALAVLKRVAEDAPRPIREIIPETPIWLCSLIGRLHQKRPEDRFQSAREVAGILQHCLSEVMAGRTPQLPSAAIPSTAPATDGPAGSSDSGSMSDTPPSAVRKPRGLPEMAILAIATAAGLGIAAWLVVLLVPRLDRTDAPLAESSSTHDSPGSSPPAIESPLPMTPHETLDPDREAAERVVSIGGWVGIRKADGTEVVAPPAPLPAQPFVVFEVHIPQSSTFVDADLACLRNCKHLQSVYLGDLPGLTDDGLLSLADTPIVLLGMLRCRSLTDRAAQSIARISTLQELQLYDLPLTGECLTHLRPLRHLRSITLDCPLLHNSDIAGLGEACPWITRLDIVTAADPSRVTAEVVQSFPNLQTAQISGNQLSDKSIDAFNSHPVLKKLLVLAPISDGAMHQLSKLNSIQSLAVQSYQREDEVTLSAAIYSRIDLPSSLTQLYLNGNSVAPQDVDFLHFAELKHLKLLYLSCRHSNVSPPYTDAGLSRFRALRPDVNLQDAGGT